VEALALTPSESALLGPDHPFLNYGRWRAFAITRGSVPGSRVVASIDPRQQQRGEPVGCIGFIGEADAVRGARDMERVMAAALAWLRGEGARTIRCPVQFSTWFAHRAMTAGYPEQGGRPAFALEPTNGPALIEALAACGFTPAAQAVSCLVPHDALIEGARPALERLQAAGLRDRPLELTRLDAELATLRDLACAIFEGSWAFSGISLEEFDSLYRPFAQMVDPELVRVLESPSGEALGFSFAVPEDLRNPDGGGVVIKTLGLLPTALRRYPGAGLGLIALTHRIARDRGHSYAIHALMARDGAAHRVSMRWGTVIRSYATFERELGSPP
jgi:hypothetical protein